MRRVKKRLIATCARPLIALVPAIASFAAPALAATNPQEQAESPVGWVYRWINFSIFVGVLIYVFYKKTPPFFRRRQEVIGEAIAESSRAREAAERQQREIDEKMATLDAQVVELREHAKRESAGEVERIRALAKEEAKRIEQAAKFEILVAERAAQIELKALASRLAIERAEGLLRQQVTPHKERVLFSGFLTELEGIAN
jgi:F-type H+-transporting ATPase subunit b